MAAPTLRAKTIAGYAIGSLGTGGFATLPGLVLLIYMTDTLGVPAIAAGAVIGVAKVWDILIDPVIGSRSDRALRRRGTRRGPMVLGAIGLPVFFILTFAVPAGTSPTTAALWVALAFLVTATAFSLFQVPYIALPAEIAATYDDRTRLLSWRVVVLTIAILLFGAGGPLLVELGGDDKYLGYLIMAVVGGLVIGIGMLIAITVVPRHQKVSTDDEATSVAQSYRLGIAALRRSQPFRALLTTFLLQGLATGMMLTGAAFVAKWVLGSPGATTTLFIALIAPAIVFAPVWAAIARRIGKERAFLIATAIYMLAAVSLLGMLAQAGPWIYLPVGVAGMAYAGMQALPMSMLPDVINHDAARNGQGLGGSFGGVWTAGETTGMALGALVVSLILAISGYAEATAGQTVTQSPEAITGIILSFSLVPAVFMGLSIISLLRYRLRRSDIEAIQDSETISDAPSIP